MTTLFLEFLSNNQSIVDSLFNVILSLPKRAPIDPLTEKSSAEAVRLRICGNKAYGSKQYKEALKYYSESISTAPNESEELALAFGNRSAVLFVLKKYELSLLDVNRALKKNNCPSASADKLRKRKTNCWIRIQDENAMKMKISQALPSTNSRMMTPIERKILYVNNLSIDDDDLNIDFNSFEDPMWSTKFDNCFLSDVSSKVKLETSAQWGRHWIATEDIASGEVLSIEKFLVKTSHESESENCGHCSTRCEALIPCPTCIWQMYCSERCRQEAYELYHRVECRMGPTLEADDIGLALRLFLVGTKQGNALNDLIKNPNVFTCMEGKWNCVDTPYPDDYLSVLNLNWKTNSQDFRLFFHQYLATMDIAAFLFNRLLCINFFGKEHKCETFQDFSEIEVFAAFLLFHNLSLTGQYCGAIRVYYTGLEFEESREKVDIGVGIGTYQCLMNHSCNANSFVLMNKQRILNCSLRPIKAGEQIFTTYGLSYWSNSKQERAQIFEKVFKMECQCIACVENWPTWDELDEIPVVYLTSKKKIIKKVGEKLKWISTLMNYAMKPTMENSVHLTEANLKLALEYNLFLKKYVKEPSFVHCFHLNLIPKFMIEKAGNSYLTPSTTQILDKLALPSISE